MDNSQNAVQDYDFAKEYNNLMDLPEGVVILHKDFQTQDLQSIASPLRRRFDGKFETNDPASYFEYVKSRQEEPEAELNRTFVNAESPTDRLYARTVLNFGTTNAAGHGDDLAILNLQKDPLFVELLRSTSSYAPSNEFAEALENFLGLNVLVGFKEDGLNEIALPAAVAAIRNSKVDRQQSSTLKTGGLQYEASDMEKIELENVDANLADVFVVTTPVYLNLTHQQVKLRVDVKFVETEKGLRALYALRPVGLLGHYIAAAKDFQDRISTQLSNVSIGKFSA